MEIKRILVNLQPQPIKAIRLSTVIQGSGTGDVVGPSSSVAGNFASFADTTGKLLDDSGFGPNSFVEPGDLAAVATSGSYNDLTDVPSTFTPSAHASSHVTSGTDKIRDATASQDGLMTTAYAGKLDGIEANADVTDAANVGSAINGSTEKTTPADSDKLPILDSAASFVLKWFSWSNLKATLKTYFDTLYPSGSGTSSGTNTGDQNLFGTIAVSGQSDVAADSTNDTLTLAAGSGIAITTDPTTDTVTIAATGGGGSGDVTGPASSTDNAIARFDGTGGKTLQNSGLTISDGDTLNFPGNFVSSWGDISTSGAGVLVGGNMGVNLAPGYDAVVVSSTGKYLWDATGGPTSGTHDLGLARSGSALLKVTDGTTGYGAVDLEKVQFEGGPEDLSGSGSPEGAVSADVGSTYRRTDGGTNTTLYRKESGTGNTGWVAVVNGGGSGDVVGPASATDNALARYDSTTGKLIQDSTVTLSDTGDFSAVNSLDFTPITAPAHNEGLLYYDEDRKTLTAYIDEPDVSLQIGFEMWARVRNATGSTVTNGQVVYISGATGQRPNITLAQANTLPTSRVIGVATHDIENNTDGIVTVFGTVRDLDTSAFTDGAVVYLSATTPGALTATAPAAPNLVVQVGVVQHAHITQGKILIHPEMDSVDADNIYNSTAAARAFIKNIDSSTGITVQTGSTTFAKRNITGTSNEITVTNGDGVSGNPTVSLPATIDLGGKTSLEIPNSAAPSLSAIGQVALDTTVTDFTGGVFKYYDSSSAESGVVAMPISEFTSPSNGAVPTYDSTTDRFKLTVPSGGSGVAGASRFRVTKSANQSLSGSTETTVTWDTEDYDNTSIFASNGATIPSGEYWLMIVRTQWENMSAAFQATYKFKDNTTILRQLDAYHRNATATEEYTDTFTTVIVGTGNPITFTAQQSTGASQSIQGGALFTEWTGVRLW